MRGAVACSVAALVGIVSTAQAATLVGVSGQVLVNRGNGFQLAQPGLELKPGDLVVANPGATAQIAYPEGCSSPVVPGVIASIAAKAPCAAPNASAPQTAAPALSPGVLGVGAAVVGGGALAYALSNSGSSSSSSGTNSKSNTTTSATVQPASP